MKTLSHLETERVSGGDACTNAVGLMVVVAAAGSVTAGVGGAIVAFGTALDCAMNMGGTGAAGYTNDTVGAGNDTSQLGYVY
jgi:hypothetical protein